MCLWLSHVFTAPSQALLRLELYRDIFKKGHAKSTGNKVGNAL